MTANLEKLKFSTKKNKFLTVNPVLKTVTNARRVQPVQDAMLELPYSTTPATLNVLKGSAITAWSAPSAPKTVSSAPTEVAPNVALRMHLTPTTSA